MRICYLDESEQQQDGVYYIGALVVTAEQIRSIDRDLDALHARLHEAHPGSVPAGLEFHGHAIFQGKEGWAELKPGVRAWASQKAVELICRHSPWFGLQGVDVDGLRRRRGWEGAEPHVVASSHRVCHEFA
ncbi:hypothetical protein [Micrococcus luteus]|uniref:hypothetical protein n=1 Tax=Micrococcus luteus TaxID=1270 RepID=UPI000C7D0DA8|nr:hypothetical protein [Micrococcus luteus]PLA45899.1 hypothetical protein CYJ93_08680 [Micrococcus luteus]